MKCHLTFDYLRIYKTKQKKGGNYILRKNAVVNRLIN